MLVSATGADLSIPSHGFPKLPERSRPAPADLVVPRLLVNVDLLHDIESPSASGGRGLVRGAYYTADGALVASTAQEGLIRDRRGE